MKSTQHLGRRRVIRLFCTTTASADVRLSVEAAISTLRAELSSWIERARAGEEVVVTDRGISVARLLGVAVAPLLDRLTQQGLLTKPSGPRPAARGATRSRATGPVSDLIGEQRR